MAAPTSGRVTGLAIDPSDPSYPDDKFDFTRTPGPDDTSSAGSWPDGFTGGVFVATNSVAADKTGLPYGDDFAYAQPMTSHELAYGNSFTCIPDNGTF